MCDMCRINEHWDILALTRDYMNPKIHMMGLGGLRLHQFPFIPVYKSIWFFKWRKSTTKCMWFALYSCSAVLHEYGDCSSIDFNTESTLWPAPSAICCYVPLTLAIKYPDVHVHIPN
jgi:hypothetical protein